MKTVTPQQQARILRDLFEPQDGYERLLSGLRDWPHTFTVESIRNGFIVPLLTDEDRRNIDEAISTLEPRSAEIVRKYWGIGCAPQTLAEIANHFGLQPERIRQIKERAVHDLRHPSRRKYLENIPSSWAKQKDEVAALRQQVHDTKAAAAEARVQLEVLRQYKEAAESLNLPLDAATADLVEKRRIFELLQKPVEELELSVRSANCLRAFGVVTLGDLVQMTELQLLKCRNFGRKSLQELVVILERLGLHFGMDVSSYV